MENIRKKLIERMQSDISNLQDVIFECEDQLVILERQSSNLKNLKAKKQNLKKIQECREQLSYTSADLREYTALVGSAEELENLVKKERKETTRIYLTSQLKTAQEALAKKEEELMERYGLVEVFAFDEEEEIEEVEEKMVEEEPVVTEVVEDYTTVDKDKQIVLSKDKTLAEYNRRKRNKGCGCLVLAVLILLLGTGILSKACSKTASELEKEPTSDSAPVEDEKEEQVEKEEVNENAFVDANNEEQVSKRAEAIMTELDNSNPTHNFTQEEIEEMLVLINGGNVGAKSDDEAVDKIINFHDRFAQLLNLDSVYASNKIVGIEVSDLPKVDKGIDLSLFFTDGSQAQNYIKEVIQYRNAIIANPSDKANVEENGKAFNKIYTTTWALNDVHGLYGKSNGGQEVASMLILNSTAFMLEYPEEKGFDFSYVREVTINGETTSQVFTIKDSETMVNSPECDDPNMTDYNKALQELLQEQMLFVEENNKTLTLSK